MSSADDHDKCDSLNSSNPSFHTTDVYNLSTYPRFLTTESIRSRVASSASNADTCTAVDEIDSSSNRTFDFETKFDGFNFTDLQFPTSGNFSLQVGEHDPGSGDHDAEAAGTASLPSVGFWHESLRQTRKEVGKRYSMTLFFLCVSVMAILSIYWGVLFNVKTSLHKATVAVVSFEADPPYQNISPRLTPIFRSVLENEMATNPFHLGYKFLSASDFDHDPLKVRLSVFNEEHWAAIIINSNATALLKSALDTSNTSYDPLGAAQIIYNQARDVENHNFYVIPTLSRVSTTIVSQFGTNWTASILNTPTYNSSSLAAVPQALSPAIGFTNYNLRPFDPPFAIPTITIGLIYLIIIAFFSFTFFVPTHMKFLLQTPHNAHPPLKFRQMIIYRYLATLTAYLFLSLSYSLVSLLFTIPFAHSPPQSAPENSHGHWSKILPANNANSSGSATFVIYWLLNFGGMTALGLACENMAMLLGALSSLPLAGIWLIFWVITNVSTGFYALELASLFYAWGYVWPLRQVVEGSKTLVFGTRSRLGYNFGILVLWIALGTVLFPVACWVMSKTGQRKSDLKKIVDGVKRMGMRR